MWMSLVRRRSPRGSISSVDDDNLKSHGNDSSFNKCAPFNPRNALDWSARAREALLCPSDFVRKNALFKFISFLGCMMRGCWCDPHLGIWENGTAFCMIFFRTYTFGGSLLSLRCRYWLLVCHFMRDAECLDLSCVLRFLLVYFFRLLWWCVPSYHVLLYIRHTIHTQLQAFENRFLSAQHSIADGCLVLQCNAVSPARTCVSRVTVVHGWYL